MFDILCCPKKKQIIMSTESQEESISALVAQIGGLLNQPNSPAAPQILDSKKVEEEESRLKNSVNLGKEVVPVKSWDELDLKPEIRRALVEVGFVKPSIIQETALPLIITHKRNVIAQAKNGSGKTASFSIGILSVVDPNIAKTQAIVLSPTRELAKQNLDVISQLGKFCGLSLQLVVPMAEGLARSPGESSGPQIISGTPGKVLELLRKKAINGKSVSMFVLDEADVMISTENNMGVQVSNIRSLLNPNVQVVLFSATYPESVGRFAAQIVPNAAKIQVKTTDLTLSTIWQVYIDAGPDSANKFTILSDLYAVMNVGQSIIFVNSRSTAFELAKKMKEIGHSVSLICGNAKNVGAEMMIDPVQRDKVLDEFRNGVSKVLISTDVLARGIDVPAVTLVINYELPINYESSGGADRKSVNFETYLHRIGRTGRFGQKGVAVNLITSNEIEKINSIKEYYNSEIEKIESDIDVLENRLKEIETLNKSARTQAVDI